MSMLIALLAPQQSGGAFDLTFIVMIVAIFAIMYLFMIRPQQKKQKEIQKFRDSLQPGAEVVTYGGIHGVIKSIDAETNTVMLEIATGVKIKVEKSHLFGDAKATMAR